MSLMIFAALFPLIITSDVLGMNEKVDGSNYSFCIPKDNCRLSLVETIPENMTYPAGSPSLLSTFEAWKILLNLATTNLDIASFYWTLRGSDVNYTGRASAQGEEIFKELITAAQNPYRKIKIRISQNAPQEAFQAMDTKELQQRGVAEVRYLNFTKWFGAGILHTKLWVVDSTHFYIGSANMDFRSLSQVKELGLLALNCSCLAQDISKIFEVYWFMGSSEEVPKKWPLKWATSYNQNSPFNVSVNQTSDASVYISSSPPAFCPRGRTADIDGLLKVIDSSKKFINVAVMDYFPALIYWSPKKFWPRIDDALRKAAIDRKVTVQLLASHWSHTDKNMMLFLKSLSALDGSYNASIQVKLFVVPGESSSRIPFSRVNHNKYMVTENTAYIGTSNWSGDYFIDTGGIGFILKSEQNETAPDLVQHLQSVFIRDWTSKFAQPLSEFMS